MDSIDKTCDQQINNIYPNPVRLKLMCYLIFTYDKLALPLFAFAMFALIFNWNLTWIAPPLAACGAMVIFHMLGSFLVKCPKCSSNIFPFEYDKQRKFKFPPVVKQIMKTNEVTCCNCHTKFKLK